MWNPRRALTLALALTALAGPARASSVKDQAGLFSPVAVRQAESILNGVESQEQVSTTIETVNTLGGESVEAVTRSHAEQAGSTGVYVLIAKAERKIDVFAARQHSGAIDATRRKAIQDAFTEGLGKRDFDGALLAGARQVGTQVSAAHAQNRPRRAIGARPGVPVNRGNQGGGFGLGSLLGIGLLIVGVLFFVRLLGSLFGGRGQGYGGRMGAPGYGPGYGGGGGGGGFMSSLFGGIGGAMAGNWLYDQFSGRHQSGYTDSSSYGGADPGVSDAGTEAGNTSGDWGGSDAGGGGDWGGGGGGDWGGGGGDTGGGDW